MQQRIMGGEAGTESSFVGKIRKSRRRPEGQRSTPGAAGTQSETPMSPPKAPRCQRAPPRGTGARCAGPTRDTRMNHPRRGWTDTQLHQHETRLQSQAGKGREGGPRAGRSVLDTHVSRTCPGHVRQITRKPPRSHGATEGGRPPTRAGRPVSSGDAGLRTSHGRVTGGGGLLSATGLQLREQTHTQTHTHRHLV